MGAGTVPALEVMKLRGKTAENFPEASWLVRQGGPGDLALESSFTCLGMAVLLLGHGCCGEAKHLYGDGASGAEQIWNPGLKAPAPHPPHVSNRDANKNDPCGWS